MGQRNGLPPREPERRPGVSPQLPAQPGGIQPYTPTERSAAEVHPGPQAPPTLRAPAVRPAPPRPVPGAPPAPTFPPQPGEEAVLPVIGFPRTFEELLFFLTLMTPAREVPVVVEQTIAAGASGSVTVAVPANRVDVARTLREAGDGSVTYRVEVDGAGRVAVAQHRVTGGERQFARFWEKYSSVIVSFENTDPANAALLQLEWVSVQVDVAKWGDYRDNVRAWAQLLGAQE